MSETPFTRQWRKDAQALMAKIEAQEGQRLTTRHFGGYESVRVLQVHPTYYIVSRFSGQTTGVLPKNKVAKAFDNAGNEVFCSDAEKGLHPEVAAIVSGKSREQT